MFGTTGCCARCLIEKSACWLLWLFTSFPGTNANVETAYRKGLAMTIKLKRHLKTMS